MPIIIGSSKSFGGILVAAIAASIIGIAIYIGITQIPAVINCYLTAGSCTNGPLPIIPLPGSSNGATVPSLVAAAITFIIVAFLFYRRGTVRATGTSRRVSR